MRTSVKKSLLVMALLLVCECTIFGGPNYAFGDSTEVLPPLPASSSFMDQIDEAACYAVEEPTQPALLRWDFGRKEVYAYDYSQKSIMTSIMSERPGGGDRNEPGMVTEVKGKMSLKSEGDRTARLVMEDLMMSMQFETSEREEPKTMDSEAPPMVIQGVQEDGTMKLGSSSQEMLLKMLFPIPSSPLRVGESVSSPRAVPFNAMGSLLEVTGSSVTTLTGYVGLDGKTCARLETVIDISNLNVPEELEGTYKCQVKGKSVFFFDIEGKRFLSGRVALIMGMRVKAPMPRMHLPSEAEDVGLPETISMSMDNDTFISVDYVD